MPRVVRDVIRITRTIRPPAREPPEADPQHPPPDTQPPTPAEEALEIVEWQVVIVIHTLPDLPMA